MIPFSFSAPITLNLNRKPESKGSREPEIEPTASHAAAIPTQFVLTFDPALVLMLVAIVMLSGAVLVYASRH
jgi:hypothetical protein